VNEGHRWSKSRKALECLRVVQTIHVYDVRLPCPQRSHRGIDPIPRGIEERHIADVDAGTIGWSICLVEKRHVAARRAHPWDDLFKV
jgi:hypothetical protein